MTHLRSRLTVVLAAAAGLAGCADATGPGEREPFGIVGGTGQSAVVGQELERPLVLRVADEQGTPLAGVLVQWQVESGGGTLSPTVSATGEDGTSSTRWTLGHGAGEQTVSAVTDGHPPLTFQATAVPGPVASITLPGDSIVLLLDDTLTLAVTARDAYGNEIRDARLEWSSTAPAQVSIAAPGRITAVGQGSARITASAGGHSAQADVAVAGWALVTAGAHHTCGITTSGATYCWGGQGLGEVGNPSLLSTRKPVPVAANQVFVRVSAGDRHTCAVTAAGQAYCWGDNAQGQLGNGGAGATSVPVAVAATAPFRTISAGAEHACGLAVSGTVYCWGRGDSGQLGGGATADERTPMPVAGDVAFERLSARGDQSCGIAGDGGAYCWGAVYESGQLDAGSWALFNIQPQPVRVPASAAFESVSPERFHACALTPDGGAYCWGDNTFGQLGSGDRNGTTSPVPVVDGHRFSAISAGAFHTCALAGNGSIYCWGFNAWGQLGNWSTTERCTSQRLRCSTIPMRVAMDEVFDAVTGGYTHTCAVTEHGRAYCWGFNRYGELGNGSTAIHHALPVRVANPMPSILRRPAAGSAG